MIDVKTFRGLFIPDTAHFTFWIPGIRDYSRQTHQHLEVTDAEIEAHLKGERGLVMSPFINEEEVMFGAYDVDIDNFQLVQRLVRKLDEYNIGCNIFKSKKKGYHIFVLPDVPVKASRLIHKLKYIRSEVMSNKSIHPKVEIFPKQELMTEKGGSKMNLPLFGSTRGMLGIDGNPIDEPEFKRTKKECLELQVPPERVSNTQSHDTETDPDVPPCITTMLEGVEDGTRNESAFELGRYFLSRGYAPNDTKILLHDWNKRNSPLLDENEVDDVMKGLRQERCNGAPNCQNPVVCRFCDKTRCKKAAETICDDPLIIKKRDGYYIEISSPKGRKQLIRVTNFTFEIVDADAGPPVIKLQVKRGEDSIPVVITKDNPTWRDILSACNLQGVPCECKAERKLKFIVLLGVELSRNKDKITYTDICEMERDELVALMDEDDMGIQDIGDGSVYDRNIFPSGWKNDKYMFLKAGPFCAKYKISSKKFARVLISYGIKRKPVREPNEGKMPIWIWLIPRRNES